MMLSYRYEIYDSIIKSDRPLSDIETMFTVPNLKPQPYLDIANYLVSNNVFFEPNGEFNGTLTYRNKSHRIYAKIKDGKFESSKNTPAISYTRHAHFTSLYFDNEGLKHSTYVDARGNKIYETFEKTVDYDYINNGQFFFRDLDTRTVYENGKVYITSKPATFIINDYLKRNTCKYYYSYNGIYDTEYNKYVESWIEKNNKTHDLITQDDLNFMQLEYKFERKANAVQL